MSGNQEPRISLPTWRCSDFNAAIPIKKRKYFVQPQLPAMEEKKNPQPNELGVVGRSGLDSPVAAAADENLKLIGGSVGIPESIGNNNNQIRVKVEAPNFPIHSTSLAGFEIPSSSLGKVAEHPGVVVTGIEQPVLKTRDIVRETCSKENLRGVSQREESSSGVGVLLGCRTKNSSPYWGNEEPTELNLSLSKEVCTTSGNHSGVSRSNWDLNTTMDDWEDGLDRKARVKTTGAFLNSNRSLHRDIETSSCRDATVIAKSVSEKQKESVGFKSPTVSLMQFDRQVNPTCSLSLGLRSYPPVEKSPSLSASTSEARAASTSFSRPVMIAGNVNSVNLRTVKSEVIEESVRQETESAQVCQIGLSISGVKQEVVGRFSQENGASSGILKPLSVKAEPNNFTQSEVFYRKDGTLNHPHTPVMQSREILDLPTSCTLPNHKNRYMLYSNGIRNAPMSLNGMPINPGVQSNSTANGKLGEVLKLGGVDMTSSCSGHGDNNLNASGVNVTSLTEEKILDASKTCISKEVPRNARETGEVSVSDEGKNILSGDDLSRVVKKQVGERNLYDDGKVQGPAAVFAESNEVAHAECGLSETEQREIAVPFHGDFHNSKYVEEKGTQPALLANTVEMANTEESGEIEGRIVHDGEQSTHQIIHTSEGVSTASGGNVENPETIDNSSPFSYKAEISTIDNDPTAEFTEGSQNRIINLAQASNKSPNKTLDASGSYVPLQMERDRFSDFSPEPRKYTFRGRSDESFKFSCERYHGKVMRSPRLNFMPDRRRLSDQTEGNLHDRDTKNFEFENHGNFRPRGGREGRGDAFMSNFRRGRRPANDEGTPYSHSFPRRTPNFSFTHRGPRNKEDTSAFPGFRDGDKATRGSQCNNTEPMFTSPPRPYQGRFARGQTKYLNNPKRDFPGYRSRSPTRSRERSPGPSSSFRNRSQEDFSGHTEFSRRKSPSGYRMERVSSPDHSGYPREMVVKRNNSPPYSHRPSYSGRGRGYSRGRGYVRGRGYGRAGFSFRNPSDRVVHRNHGNLDPRERVNYNDDFFEGPNVERRQFGYRHDSTSSFRPSFNNDGCAPTNVENDPDAVRFGQDPDIEIEERGGLMETDGTNKNSIENASGGTKNMEEEETSKHSKSWERDELCDDGV